MASETYRLTNHIYLSMDPDNMIIRRSTVDKHSTDTE